MALLAARFFFMLASVVSLAAIVPANGISYVAAMECIPSGKSVQ